MNTMTSKIIMSQSKRKRLRLRFKFIRFSNNKYFIKPVRDQGLVSPTCETTSKRISVFSKYKAGA